MLSILRDYKSRLLSHAEYTKRLQEEITISC